MILGAFGSGASGSSTISTRLRVCLGTPLNYSRRDAVILGVETSGGQPITADYRLLQGTVVAHQNVLLLRCYSLRFSLALLAAPSAVSTDVPNLCAAHLKIHSYRTNALALTVPLANRGYLFFR